MKNVTPELLALHKVYVAITNRDMPMTMRMAFAWEDWVGHGFCESDLRLVVSHIKDLIKDNRRRPESFRFHNLIEDTDRFLEDLAEARALARKPKVDAGKAAVLRDSGRKAEPDGGKFRPVGELIKAMREAIDHEQNRSSAV